MATTQKKTTTVEDVARLASIYQIIHYAAQQGLNVGKAIDALGKMIEDASEAIETDAAKDATETTQE